MQGNLHGRIEVIETIAQPVDGPTIIKSLAAHSLKP